MSMRSLREPMQRLMGKSKQLGRSTVGRLQILRTPQAGVWTSLP